MADRLEELPVFLKAQSFSITVAAIIARPTFGRNRKLHDQIADANESILANMAEGFEQSTDAVLANYLYTSKGSVAEVLTRLKGAERCGWLTPQEYSQCAALGNEIQRMLGGWIKYLKRCDWKDRGRFENG
jgi:four helix bundle protein